MFRRVTALFVSAVAACAASIPVSIAVSIAAPGTAAAASTTTRYVALQPCRLADTRDGLGLRGISPTTARISVDACGIPDDATAIVATTTIINVARNGYLVVHPSGRPAPTAATIAWRGGTIRGNSSTIAVGTDASIDLFRPDGFGDGEVTIDVVGAFVPAEAATSGRFVPEVGGRRLIDTRDTVALGAGETIAVPLPDGVPSDAIALAVNITAVDVDRGGYFTVYRAGSERPEAAVLNTEVAHQSRAASTFAPVGPDGFELYASGGGDVVVDMTGWFTGESAESGSDGLFVPISPVRLADTRPTPAPIHPGGTIDVALPTWLTDGVQDGAPSAVAVSMAMIAPRRTGYVTTHAARAERGPTASGFALAGEIASQFAVTPASDVGIAVFSADGTEMTVDLFGWFTGAATEATGPAPVNPVPRQRVLAIGDSSMAGVDRTFAHAALQGADFDFRARSCRRLVRTSCNGREGPIPPPTALDTLNSIPVNGYDVLIMMTGYNDTISAGFAQHVAMIVDVARQKGFRRIIWLTMAREFRNDKGGPGAYQVYEQHNAIIRANAAAHDFMIAPEWSSIIRQVPWWTYSDGIHLARPGGYGAADLMSRAVAHVTGQQCPQPEVPGWPTEGVCPEPGSRPPIDVQRLYGF